MFLRNESKPDPKQQALDNVLMMLVHKKMSAPTESKRSMKPSYPPARNGSTNFEPSFDPKPVSRKGGAANSDIMTALKAYMNKVQAPQDQQAPAGMFDPNVALDTSQVQDMRGVEPSGGLSMMRGIDRQNAGPWSRGPLSRTKGKGFGDKTDALGEDGGFNPRMELIRKLMSGMGR